jgi:Zn ribbon nucleic-acid-binding protein
MPVHTGRLLLVPQDPFHLPDLRLLADGLAAAGFTGSPLLGRPNGFTVGDNFLQLITFAGCSVHLSLLPTDDSPFCHVLLAGPYPRPHFASGRNTRPPRCRSCRTPVADWRDRISLWQSDAIETIQCASCGIRSAPWALDWKQSAGFGRLLVQVEEVFPGEAAPTPELMRLLASLTGTAWRYFYVQDAPGDTE